MLDRAALGALIEATLEADAAFISDEIYHGLEYEQRSVSALELTDECVVINSFSKYFSMTGWRVGLDGRARVDGAHGGAPGAEPVHLRRRTRRRWRRSRRSECGEELEANRQVYAANRELLLEGLPKAGFTNLAPPDGAFYVYADVSDITDDSLGFARELLDEAGVAVTPGLDFDAARGNTTLRFSYARSTDDIREGLVASPVHGPSLTVRAVPETGYGLSKR